MAGPVEMRAGSASARMYQESVEKKEFVSSTLDYQVAKITKEIYALKSPLAIEKLYKFFEAYNNTKLKKTGLEEYSKKVSEAYENLDLALSQEGGVKTLCTRIDRDMWLVLMGDGKKSARLEKAFTKDLSALMEMSETGKTAPKFVSSTYDDWKDVVTDKDDQEYFEPIISDYVKKVEDRKDLGVKIEVGISVLAYPHKQ